MFVHIILNCNVPKHFDNFISIKNTQHKIGKQSIKYLCAITWNEILKSLSSVRQKEGKTYKQNWMKEMSINTLKYIISEFFVNSY